MIFLTEELRYSFDSNNGSRLLIAAAAVLSAGISSSRHMSRSGAVYAGYAWMVSDPFCHKCARHCLAWTKLLSFTLPSATLLATRLKDSAHLGSKALHPLSWQVVFHQLSALALDLETIAETLDHHDPGIEGGSTIVTNALDEALGARMAAPLAVQANPQSVDVYEPFPGNGLEH